MEGRPGLNSAGEPVQSSHESSFSSQLMTTTIGKVLAVVTAVASLVFFGFVSVGVFGGTNWQKTADDIQAMLDRRRRNIRHGVGTFVQSAHYSQHHTDANSWWSYPALIGGQWYVHSNWQQKSKKLFDAAALVEKRLKTQ